MMSKNSITLSTSPQTRLARKPRCFANLTNQRRFLYGRSRRYHTGKELSGTPAVSEYIPQTPINQGAPNYAW